MSGLLRSAFTYAVLILALGITTTGTARAEKVDARKHYERATAAFGLGRYAEAASEYEAAFRLRPDPALLYNCAQSYRLAGDRPRAVELYRNYLRLYGDAPNAEDARKHLANLELEVAAEKTVTPPPVPPRPVTAAPAPVGAPRPAPSSLPATAAAPAPAVAATAQPQPPPPPATASPTTAPPPLLEAPPPTASGGEVHLNAAPAATPVAADDGERPLLRRPVFWVGVGAVAVAVVVTAVLLSGGDKDPKASLGTVVAN